MKKLRPLGKILLDLEELIDEAIDTHDLQHGDLLNWLYGHLKSHRDDAAEEYVMDDSNPVFLYGHKSDVKKWARKL